MKPGFFLSTLLIGAMAATLSTAALSENSPEQTECFFLNRECLSKERIQRRKDEQERQNSTRRKEYLEEKSRRNAEREEDIRRRVEQSAQATRDAAEQRQVKAEEESRLQDEKSQQRQAERAKRGAEMDAENLAYEKQEQAARRKRTAVEEQVKATCGGDYKTPSIGMDLQRVRQCIGPVKLTGQVNRSDGVASVYTYGALWINVMSGRVVAWGK